jgi:hypothetical protein
MIHALIITLLNNQTTHFDPLDSFNHFTPYLDINQIKLKMNEIQDHELFQKFLEFTNYVTELISMNIIKMNELIKSNNYISNILLLIIIFTMLLFVTMIDFKCQNDNIQEILDQLQYLKKKSKNQEIELDYVLDCNIKYDIKFNKLNKQIKNLRKEMNKYE